MYKVWDKAIGKYCKFKMKLDFSGYNLLIKAWPALKALEAP